MDVSARAPLQILWALLSARLDRHAAEWLSDQHLGISAGWSYRSVFAAFNAVPSWTGTAPIRLTPEEVAATEAVRDGWSPGRWNIDEAARCYLLLALPDPDESGESFLPILAATSEHRGLAALYRSLPLLPSPESHRAFAAEGIRSNVLPVFDAIALYNPYPSEQLPEEEWNALVVKALFVGSPVEGIVGLERRANGALARQLIDFARQRWSARREVPPSLWRLLGYCGEAGVVAELNIALHDPDPVQQRAAALALYHSPLEEARQALGSHPEMLSALQEGRLSWESLQREWRRGA